MTAILSQMDDRHYATYIETFSGTSDLVVSTQTHPHAHLQMSQNCLTLYWIQRSVYTHILLLLPICCRTSWWSPSYFSRTWLGNMCITLTGWPWSWCRTGTIQQAYKCMYTVQGLLLELNRPRLPQHNLLLRRWGLVEVNFGGLLIFTVTCATTRTSTGMS